MNACFCNGIQNPPTWRVFLLEWVAVLRVEWVAGLVSLQVEGFDRYVWLSWGGIRICRAPTRLAELPMLGSYVARLSLKPLVILVCVVPGAPSCFPSELRAHSFHPKRRPRRSLDGAFMFSFW